MKQEEVWNAIARPWKEFRHYDISHVVEFLKEKKGNVLDLGCGSGRNFLKRKGLDFYGLDFSIEMVRLAREMDYVEVKKGEVFEIPYEDGFFDFVVFSAVLHCVESKENRMAALRECYRVLKKDGEMIISVWGRGEKRIKNRDKEGFVPWNVDGKKFERYTYIYDLEELRQDLESVGFRILREEEGRNLIFWVGKS